MAAEDRKKMSVSLTCKDMEKSLAFYRDGLGFEIKESWPDQGTPMWCNLLLGGQSLMLGAAMDLAAIVDVAGLGKEAQGKFALLAAHRRLRGRHVTSSRNPACRVR